MSWGAQRLQDWRDRLNPEASSSRIGAGFASIAAGTALAVLGVGLVVLNDLALPRPSWLREVGFVAAAAGLPLFLMGLAITLRSTWIERTAVAIGSLAVGASVTAFSLWYPDAWHLTVQAPNGYAIAGYLIGVTLMSAGAASCLARHLVDAARPVQAAADEEGQRQWTDADVREDLRWAEEQGWTWGGISQAQPKTQITLEEEVESVQFKGRGAEFLTSEEAIDASETSSQRLRALQGRMEEDRTRVDPGTVDDQVGDLKELKRRKREQRQKQRQSWAWRLRHPLKWLGGS